MDAVMEEKDQGKSYYLASRVYINIYVTRFWKTDQAVTNSISSNNDFKY